jgi:hypothetical protein
MHRGPSLASANIGALREGARVRAVAGAPTPMADGYTWIQVVDRRGRVGWIPLRYLVSLAP